MSNINIDSKWLIGIIATVIIALVGVVYNGIAQNIEENKETLKKLDEEKVDNDILKLLIQQLQKGQDSQDKKWQKTSEQILNVMEELKIIKEEKLKLPNDD